MEELVCEPVQPYCSTLRSASSELVIPAGFHGEDAGSFQTRDVLRVSETFSVESGVLGSEAVFVCPPKYHRVGGDVAVVCDHGSPGLGAWRRQGANVTLVDEDEAEPLVCELDEVHGARRQFFTGAGDAYGVVNGAGLDVVPNIDFETSPYDSTFFEAHVRPSMTGPFLFSVEFVGRVLLASGGSTLLAGRSQGAAPALLTTVAINLSSSDYVDLSLRHTLDPVLPDVDVGPVRPHIRLMWESQDLGLAREPVPATALYHSLEMLHGFPRRIHTLNAPPSQLCRSIHGRDYVGDFITRDFNDTFSLLDGSGGRSYNPDMYCSWRIRKGFSAECQFWFFAGAGGIHLQEPCGTDRIEFSTGNLVIGEACGYYAPGQFVFGVPNLGTVYVEFFSDSLVEYGGFNLTFVTATEFDEAPFVAPAWMEF